MESKPKARLDNALVLQWRTPMCGSTYNGLVRPSDWLSEKITVIDENWFERMSKRKLFYQP